MTPEITGGGYGALDGGAHGVLHGGGASFDNYDCDGNGFGYGNGEAAEGA